jgi:hypothetical protein
METDCRIIATKFILYGKELQIITSSLPTFQRLSAKKHNQHAAPRRPLPERHLPRYGAETELELLDFPSAKAGMIADHADALSRNRGIIPAANWRSVEFCLP